MSGSPSADVNTRRILLVRFHSLGDTILTTGIGEALAQRDEVHGQRRTAVEVWTEERFFPVFAGLPWVTHIWGRRSDRGARTADRVAWPVGPYQSVVDLQGTPGSRRACARLGPVRTLRTRAAARRWVVLWGDRFPRPTIPHAVGRYAEAAGLESREAPRRYRPRMAVTPEEEDEARRLAPTVFAAPAKTALVVLTGASRRTKEYPAESFGEVVDRLDRSGTPVWWVEPPGPNAGGDAAPAPESAVRLRLPLGALKAVLARARLAISSDSGPMHMAGALGTPVLALFGSSVAGFGFSPCGLGDRILEVGDLACRPCGVHGRNQCWLGHWRCVRDLDPGAVVEASLEMLRQDAPPAEESGSVAVPDGTVS